MSKIILLAQKNPSRNLTKNDCHSQASSPLVFALYEGHAESCFSWFHESALSSAFYPQAETAFGFLTLVLGISRAVSRRFFNMQTGSEMEHQWDYQQGAAEKRLTKKQRRQIGIFVFILSVAPGTRIGQMAAFTMSLHSLAGQFCNWESGEFSCSAFLYRQRSQIR